MECIDSTLEEPALLACLVKNECVNLEEDPVAGIVGCITTPILRPTCSIPGGLADLPDVVDGLGCMAACLEVVFFFATKYSFFFNLNLAPPI